MRTRKPSQRVFVKNQVSAQSTLRWAALNDNDKDEVIALLHVFFEGYREARKLARAHKRDTHRTRLLHQAKAQALLTNPALHAARPSPGDSAPTPAAPTEGEQSNASAGLPSGCVVGVNACRRALGRGECAVLVVCKDATPVQCVSHLVPLAHSLGVPLCPLVGACNALGHVLGLKSCLAIGFKACATTHALIATLGKRAIVPVYPSLAVPGALESLNQGVSELAKTVQRRKPATRGTQASKGPKRKRRRGTAPAGNKAKREAASDEHGHKPSQTPEGGKEKINNA